MESGISTLKKIGNQIKSSLSFSSFYFYVLYLLAFFAGGNFFKSRGLLCLLLIALALLKAFFCKNIHFSVGLVLIFICFALFAVFYNVYYGFTLTHVLVYFVVPVGFFIVGSSFAGNSEQDKHQFFLLLFWFAFGFFFNEQLNIVYTLANGISLFNENGTILEFWTRSPLARTIYSLDLIPIISLSLAVLLNRFKKKKWYESLFFLCLLVYSFSSSTIIGNRSILIIVPATFFLSLLALCFFDKGHSKFYVITFCACCFASLLLILLILGDVFGIKDILMGIPSFERLFNGLGSKVGRSYQYLVFFQNFWRYPFGGLATSGLIVDYAGSYATNMHNVWLQAYCIGGYPLFFIFFVTSFYFFFRFFKFDFSKMKEASFTLFAGFSIVVGMFCLYFFEPLFETDPYLSFLPFIIFGFFSSLTDGYFSRKKGGAIHFSENSFKIVWISNFLSIHSLSTAEEMFRIYGERFTFVSSQAPLRDHLLYSEGGLLKRKSYEVRCYENKDLAEEKIKEADVILYSDGCERLIGKYRFHHFHKLFICISERPFKKSEFQQYSFRFLSSVLFHFKRSLSPDYLLTMSAYAASDYENAGFFYGRSYSWGYWVPDYPSNNLEPIFRKKGELKILFANRMIDWKHPELAITLAGKLKERGIPFSLVMAGDGPLSESLKKRVKDEGLDGEVTFVGVVGTSVLRQMMENSDIVLSLSSKEEGWGSSVLEGMLSGCAVVASCGTGSAPFLISNWKNGVLFDETNSDSLFESISVLNKDRALLRAIQQNAFEKSHKDFIAKEAVSRFSLWLQGLISGETLAIFLSGPCSKDPALHEQEVREKVSSELLSRISCVSGNGGENPNPSTKIRQKSKWAIVSYISLCLSVLLGLLYTPWIVRTLGQSSYAIYSLASSVCALAAIDFGGGSIVANKLSAYKLKNDFASGNRYMGTVFKLYGVLDAVLLCVLLSIFFTLNFLYPKLTPDEISSLRICFSVVGMYTLISFELSPLNGVLIGNDHFVFIKLFSLVSRIVNVVLTIILLSLGGGLFDFVVVIAFSGIFELALKIFFCYKKCPCGGKQVFSAFDKKSVSALIKESLWFVVITLCNRMLMSIAPSILGFFCGSAQIAIFSLAWTIEGNVYNVASALDGMFLPSLTRLSVEKRQAEYTDEISKIGRIQLLITGFLIAGFVCFGKGFILNVWKVNVDGYDYTDSYYSLLILLIPGIFTFTQSCAENIFLVEGKMKYQALAYFVSGLISITCGCILCYFFPDKGSILISSSIAFAKIIGLVIVMAVLFSKILNIQIKKFYKNTYLSILPMLFVLIAIGFLIEYFLPTTGWKTLIEKAFLFSILYFAFSWGFVLNSFEKGLITNILSPVKRAFQKMSD